MLLGLNNNNILWSCPGRRQAPRLGELKLSAPGCVALGRLSAVSVSKKALLSIGSPPPPVCALLFALAVDHSEAIVLFHSFRTTPVRWSCLSLDGPPFSLVPILLSKIALSSLRGQPHFCSEAGSGKTQVCFSLKKKIPLGSCHSHPQPLPCHLFPLWPMHFAVETLGKTSKAQDRGESYIEILGCSRKSLPSPLNRGTRCYPPYIKCPGAI